MTKANNYKEKRTSATQKLMDNTTVAKSNSNQLKISIFETTLMPTSTDTLFKHQYTCIQIKELDIQKVPRRTFGKTECFTGLLFHVVQTTGKIFYYLFEMFL